MKESRHFKDFFDAVTEEWDEFANSDGFFYVERDGGEESEYLQGDLIAYTPDFKKAKIFYSYIDAEEVMHDIQYDNSVFVSRMTKTKTDVENDIKKLEIIDE